MDNDACGRTFGSQPLKSPIQCFPETPYEVLLNEDLISNKSCVSQGQNNADKFYH